MHPPWPIPSSSYDASVVLRTLERSMFSVPTSGMHHTLVLKPPKHGHGKTPYLHLPCNFNWPGTGIESASASAM